MCTQVGVFFNHFHSSDRSSYRSYGTDIIRTDRYHCFIYLPSNDVKGSIYSQIDHIDHVNISGQMPDLHNPATLPGGSRAIGMIYQYGTFPGLLGYAFCEEKQRKNEVHTDPRQHSIQAAVGSWLFTGVQDLDSVRRVVIIVIFLGSSRIALQTINSTLSHIPAFHSLAQKYSHSQFRLICSKGCFSFFGWHIFCFARPFAGAILALNLLHLEPPALLAFVLFPGLSTTQQGAAKNWHRCCRFFYVLKEHIQSSTSKYCSKNSRLSYYRYALIVRDESQT